MKNLNVTRLAIAMAIALGWAVAANAQNVVVRSSGPSASIYPPGKRLADNARITLNAQDVVTVLGKDGTRVLRGPANVSLADRSGLRSTSSARVAGFISDRGKRRARAGAYRGSETPGAGAPTKPNIWYLDVKSSGNFCVVGSSVALWRPDYTGSASVNIITPETGVITPVNWEENETVKAWPSETAPVQEGMTYRLIASGSPSERSVTFRSIDTVPEDEISLTEALLTNSCQSQLDDLLEIYGGDTP